MSTPNASTILVATSPADLVIEVNGTPATTPFSFLCDPGTNRTINAPSPQVNGSIRYTFLNWSDGGSQFHTIDCTASGNYTASFSWEYRWTIDTDPTGLLIEVDGTLRGAPVVFWCPAGSDHALHAPSPQGSNASTFEFVNWGDGGGQTRSVPCDRARSFVAFFRTTATLTIFANHDAGLIVEVDGLPHVLPYFFQCDLGTVHVLSVPTPQTVAGRQWEFVGWVEGGPNPWSISCDRSRNYTANFVQVDVQGPTPPPFPPIALVLLAILIPAVVVPAAVLWWVSRRRTPSVEAPRIGLGAMTPPAVTTRCPNCGNSGPPDWMYCMMCGTPLR